METADYYRQKAAQCRRLAGSILHQNDPAVGSLLALAVEFEAQAVALAAEQAAETQIEQTTDDSPKPSDPTTTPLQTPKPKQRPVSRRRVRKGKAGR